LALTPSSFLSVSVEVSASVSRLAEILQFGEKLSQAYLKKAYLKKVGILIHYCLQ
jgi:hypothetical protein